MVPSNQRAVLHLRRADPRLAAVMARVGKCRYAPFPNLRPFEALASSIVYQQISGYAAAAILARLERLCGGRLRPRPVLASPTDALRGVGLSRQKISYLKDLAQKCETGLRGSRLARLSDEAVIETLTEVKGIGRWTAEMFLMFRLGRLDVLPTGDLGIRKAMQLAYGKRVLPKPAWMTATAEAWRPYRTIASWYLWQSLEAPGTKRQKRLKEKKGKR